MKALISAILAISLVACGGGGGSGPEKAAPQAAPSGTATVLFYGDSTFEGAPYPNRTQAARVSDRLGIPIDSAAVSATRLFQLLAGSDGRNPPLRQSLALHPNARFVLENFGINDSGMQQPETFRNDLRQFVLEVRAAGRIPILVTPNPSYRSDPALQASFLAYVQVIREVAAEQGAHLIDVNAQFAWITNDDLTEGVHPLPAVYEQIADFLAAELQVIMN